MQAIIHIQNEPKHSEMGPVRQNPIQINVTSIRVYALHCALCTIVAHNIAQLAQRFEPNTVLWACSQYCIRLEALG